MSKRNYRRLAVVAGAALAVGSMAPAMAQRSVEANAAGSASVNPNFDLGDLTGSLPVDLGGLLTQATGLTSQVQAQVAATRAAVQNDVASLSDTALGTVLGLPGALLGGPSSPIASLDAVGNVLGVVGVDAGGAVSAPLGAVGALTGAPSALLNDVQSLQTLGQVQNTVGFATQTALGAVGTVSTLPGTVLALPGGLLAGGLEDILGLAGGAGSLNVVASLLGTF